MQQRMREEELRILRGEAEVDESRLEDDLGLDDPAFASSDDEADTGFGERRGVVRPAAPAAAGRRRSGPGVGEMRPGSRGAHALHVRPWSLFSPCPP